ncbi:glycosyltransferase [Priestia koreensis]|uniref:glycosyltransferase n=1 Tax=Priestia koreensis TaxID=284581 RepID=UPI001F57CC16|nr:glycosyltransferase family 2 protein [Priestia koreensis]UNL83610.1 glycosyltransferase family 2 protein [Priestia koreensis]
MNWIVSGLAVILGMSLIWRISYIKRTSLQKGRNAVSVIIPARNEEKNIEQLLQSLLSQWSDALEIIVMDDHSDDRTAEIANYYGARVISVPDLPNGWLGKSWACWNGALAAQGEHLLFLDADIIVDEGGLQKLLNAYSTEKGWLSVQPYHRVENWYEYGSAFFNLITMISMRPKFMPNGESSMGAFGQCLLCSKSAYFYYGGHDVIKQEIVENMALGQHVVRHGGKIRCISGKGTISMRMYPDGFRTLVNGWSKSFASGAAATNPYDLLLISTWITGSMTIAIKLFQASGEGLYVLLALYGLLFLQFRWSLSKIGSFGWFTAFLFPVHILFFTIVFTYSLFCMTILKKVSWKGRDIVVKGGKDS